jgi:hypothetical protein
MTVPGATTPGMKIILILVAVLAVVFAAYPLVNEGSTSPCAALESRVLTLATREGGPEAIIVAALAKELLNAGDGRLAEGFSRRNNPDVPAVLSCTTNYWRSVFDREWLLKAFRREFR